MEEILKIAKENNLFVVEDACQSIGSVYTFSDGRKVHSGCMGDIGCTSFFPSKNLGCFGDGGAIFTNDDELDKQMKVVVNHGMVVRYYHDFIGVNSKFYGGTFEGIEGSEYPVYGDSLEFPATSFDDASYDKVIPCIGWVKELIKKAIEDSKPATENPEPGPAPGG